MKKTVLVLLGGVIGFVIAWQLISQRSAGTLLRERALWEKEKGDLQMALDNAGNQKTPRATVLEKKEIVRVRDEMNPREIIQRLQQIKVAVGPGQIRNGRLVVQQFENLIATGASALPAIREFLLLNQDIDYDSSVSPKGSKEGKIATEFPLPPSLRFGLFEAAKRIGGSEAEKLLAEILGTTGRGAEVAYLANALQEIAPNKYRDLCVNTAHDLLSRPIAAGAAGLDKFDREYLYGVLALFGDGSFAADAQSHLASGGKVDRGALNYLAQTLGAQALPGVIQAYQDPALDPSKKEPLVRYALTYAGEDAQATDFWHKAVNDPTFPYAKRRELIEDLNQDGLQNEKNPTARDAQLIANRLALVDRFYNETQDPVLRDAWREAAKDLKHMGQQFLSQPETPFVLGEDSKPLRDALLTGSKTTR